MIQKLLVFFLFLLFALPNTSLVIKQLKGNTEMKALIEKNTETDSQDLEDNFDLEKKEFCSFKLNSHLHLKCNQKSKQVSLHLFHYQNLFHKQHVLEVKNPPPNFI